MRQHKINNEFIYNESLREITSLRSNAAVKMTFMRARCLSYLIENAHQELITREGVAYAVWGERGKFISDANLTQLIYLLRRVLKKIGLQELFMTLPRQGIKINENIVIDTSDLPQPYTCKKPHRHKNIIAVIIYIILAILAVFYLPIRL